MHQLQQGENTIFTQELNQAVLSMLTLNTLTMIIYLK
jgi:hypothetical protein